jgi:hypothetical protein
MATPLSLQRGLIEYAVNEASIAGGNFAALARCRTPPEFLALYGRFIYQFLGRSTLRAMNLSNDRGRTSP